jgi:hypothetical protein
MYSENYLPNISSIHRTTVLRQAREFSNQQEDWGEIKKSIYIATIVHLSGMGYEDSYKLFPKTFQPFSSFMTSFFNAYSNNQTDYIHGGMDYDNAHQLIIHCTEFQNIDS